MPLIITAGNPAAERLQAPAVEPRVGVAVAGQLRHQRPLSAPDGEARRHGLDRAALIAVKEELDVVGARHLQSILDHDAARALVEGDPPAVQDRVRKAQVPVVPALENIHRGRGLPGVAPRARLLQPHEIATGLRLVEAVDAVMGADLAGRSGGQSISGFLGQQLATA